MKQRVKRYVALWFDGEPDIYVYEKRKDCERSFRGSGRRIVPAILEYDDGKKPPRKKGANK